MNRVYLNQKQFIRQYKETTSRNNWIRMSYRGLGSFFDMAQQVKYINRDSCDWFAIGSYNPPMLMLPGEAARAAILHYYPAGYKQSYLFNDTRIPAPIVFNEQVNMNSAVYIDIKSCYCQMYKRLHLDTMYPSLSGSLPLRPIAEFFDDYGNSTNSDKTKRFAKRARNAVTGLLYSSRIMFYDGNEYFVKRIYGSLFNPLVWYTVNMMLHELANVALSCGAIYIATDGFIFPAMSDWIKFSDLLDKTGLEFRAIAGKCRILRFGAYSIRGYAIRDTETSKTTKLYYQCLAEKIRGYSDDVINPREKMLLRTIAKRKTSWNKPLNNIIELDNIDTLTKWSSLI